MHSLALKTLGNSHFNGYTVISFMPKNSHKITQNIINVSEHYTFK